MKITRSGDSVVFTFSNGDRVDLRFVEGDGRVPAGTCYGGVYCSNGDFYLMNNYEGPRFTPAEAGEALAYFLNLKDELARQSAAIKRDEARRAYEERRARREAREARRASLKGGIGSRVGKPVGLFGG